VPYTSIPANVLIVDDPVKNQEEALSPTYRERAKNWYRATLRTRLRALVVAAKPDKVVDDAVQLGRQRLLDATGQIPPTGLAKVRDLRRFLRAADRARPVLNNDSVLSLDQLARAVPMTVPDDALLKTVPGLEFAAEPARTWGNPRFRQWYRSKFEDGGGWDWGGPFSTVIIADFTEPYDFGQVDNMANVEDDWEGETEYLLIQIDKIEDLFDIHDQCVLNPHFEYSFLRQQ
jgi:hypothetical protein